MESENRTSRAFFSGFVRRKNGSRRDSAGATLEWAREQRRDMVETQLRRRGVRDERVLAAMSQVPRHEFVPPERLRKAYEDHPLPIGGGQTISQPYIVAAMVESLSLRGTDRVLEVGTGSGYQAAVLARLAARVYTIECDPTLARTAQERLDRLGLGDKVEVIEGDGSGGYAPEAPYDAILVAAAAPDVAMQLIEQLLEGGRLAIPVGDRESQQLRLIRKISGRPAISNLGYCRFVPLLGAHGWQNI